MELQGTYAPPRIGRTSMPIPLVGPGRLALTDAGIEVSGFRRGGGGALGVVAIILGGLIGGGVLAAKFGMPPRWVTYVVVALVVTTAMWFSNSNRGKAGSNAKPWSFTVPWSSVGKAYEDTDVAGAVCIDVRKFKPSGTLHFQPDEQISVLEFVSEVSRRAKT